MKIKLLCPVIIATLLTACGGGETSSVAVTPPPTPVATPTPTPTPSPASGLSVLHSFAGASDGATPAGLTQGSDGNFYGTTKNGGTYSSGTVFKMSPAGVETVLHTFGASQDGLTPTSALIQSSDGNFYGITSSGGAIAGTVFKITSAGVETVLYSFGVAKNDGLIPTGLTLASDGNFYGTTSAGGVYGSGTVFKVTPDGVGTVLYSFGANGTDGKMPSAGIIQAADGNFYGTTNIGGTHNLGTVFKITPTGTMTILYSFASVVDATNPSTGLIQASDGNFYGTTKTGGINNYGTVYKITSAGVETVLHSFGDNTSNGIYPLAALVQGRDGNLYGTSNSGTTYLGGSIFKITLLGVKTNLQNFGFQEKNGANPQAALIVGNDGYFYGTTTTGGANNLGAVFKYYP